MSKSNDRPRESADWLGHVDRQGSAIEKVDALVSLIFEVGNEPEILDELYAIIERDAAARRHYLRVIELRSSLQGLISQSTSGDSGSYPQFPLRLPTTRKLRTLQIALGAVLTAAAVLAVVLYTGQPNVDEGLVDNDPVPAPAVAQALDPPVPPSPPAVCATVVGMGLGITEDNFSTDYHVREGERVELLRAEDWVKFATTKSADVLLQGPAAGHFQSPKLFVLEHGRVMVQDRSGDEQLIAVDYAGTTITDLGTRFGVSAGEQGQLVLEVYEGAVTVDREGARLVERLDSGKGLQLASGSDDVQVADLPERPSMADLNRRLSGISQTDGAVDFRPLIPASLVSTRGPTGPAIHVYEDRNVFRLDHDQPVDFRSDLAKIVALGGGREDVVPRDDMLRAGTLVRSYIVHFGDASATRAEGFVEFEGKILGLVFTPDRLAQSDASLGRDGVIYYSGPDDGTRGAEVDSATAEPEWLDEISISHDHHRLNLNCIVGHGPDQLRVFVSSTTL